MGFSKLTLWPRLMTPYIYSLDSKEGTVRPPLPCFDRSPLKSHSLPFYPIRASDSLSKAFFSLYIFSSLFIRFLFIFIFYEIRIICNISICKPNSSRFVFCVPYEGKIRNTLKITSVSVLRH